MLVFELIKIKHYIMDPPEIKYLSNNSLMVVNTVGKMRQLFVPIKVQVIYDTTSLKKNSWVIVEEVLPHKTHKLIYRIGNKWWSYELFKLAANF
jgi:hypothetical protein